MPNRQIDHVSLTEFAFVPDHARLVQHGSQQLLTQPLRIDRSKSQRGGEDAGLVLSLRMDRTEAVIAQFRQIDKRSLGTGKSHIRQRESGKGGSARRFAFRFVKYR